MTTLGQAMLLTLIWLNTGVHAADKTPAPDSADAIVAQARWHNTGLESASETTESTADTDADSVANDDEESLPNSHLDQTQKPGHNLEEVIVTSNQQEKSERLVSRVISISDIFRIPALRDDALRAIDTFAGIASLQGSFSNIQSQGFYFRGGNQKDNHLEIDGLPVSYVYHLGGPLVFSVINGRLVERLKLYQSNPDISYPNIGGGVIEVQLKQPQLSGFSQQYDIGTLSAGAMIEGGLGTGRDGFWLAVRRSYIDFFLSNTNIAGGNPNDQDPNVARFPEFYDIQGRWFRSMDNGFTDLTFLVSRDTFLFNLRAEKDPQTIGDFSNRRAFAVLGWRLHLDFNRNHVFTTQINYRLPRDKFAIGRQGLEDPNPGASFGSDIGTRALDLNLEHTWRSGQKFELHYGLDLEWSSSASRGFSFPVPSPDVGIPYVGITSSSTTSVEEDSRLLVQEFFAQVHYQPIPAVSAKLGLRTHNSQRMSVLPDGRQIDSHYDGFSPRVRLSYFISEQHSLYYSWGNYIQLPAPDDLSANLGNPTILDLVRSRANLVGFNYSASTHNTAHETRLEIWHRQLKSLVIPDSPGCIRCLSNQGRGLAYGLDFEWTFKGARNHYLRLAYSWLLTERRNRPTEPVYPSSADQPHTFKILYSGPLTRSHNRWRWGFFLAVNSGQPYTPVIDRQSSITDGVLFFEPVYGAVNSRRYPTYIQFNIGFSYTSKNGIGEYRFSILSLQDVVRPNITDYNYRDDFENIDSPSSDGNDLLVPSFVMVFRL